MRAFEDFEHKPDSASTLVAYGDNAGHQLLHCFSDEFRRTPHGEAVSLRPARQPHILNADFIVQSGGHAEKHAGSLRRLHEEAEDMVAEFVLQAESNAARRAAHAAGKIREQRMGRVHGDPFFLQLLFESPRRDGIAEEERGGILVVHEVAERIFRRQLPALLHREAVIRIVFHDCDASLAKELLLPRLRVRRHVNGRPIADGGAHDADAESQVAGGAHMDRVFPEKLAGRLGIEHGVIPVKQAVLQRQIFRVLQHFIDTAPRLDGARNGQMAVLLQ